MKFLSWICLQLQLVVFSFNSKSFVSSNACRLFGILFEKQPPQNLCIPSETSSIPSPYLAFDNLLKSQSITKVLFDISIQSIGLDDQVEKFLGYVSVNKMNYYTYPSRGYTVVTLTPGVGILDHHVFDVHAGADKVNAMEIYLRGLKDGTIVLVSVWDEGSLNMKNSTYDLFKMLGAKQSFPLQHRSSYALIGYKGRIRRDFVADLAREPGKGPALLTASLSWDLPWLSIQNNVLACNYNLSVNEYRWFRDGKVLNDAGNRKTYTIGKNFQGGFYQCSIDFESFQVWSPTLDLRSSIQASCTAASGTTVYVAVICVLVVFLVVLALALAFIGIKYRTLVKKGDPMYQAAGYSYSDGYQKVFPVDQQTPVPPRPKEPAENSGIPIAGQKPAPATHKDRDSKKENQYVVQSSRESGYEVNPYAESYLQMNNS